ncbi:uncharacterized protein F4822DRAFT_9312 [Hypoxylon trugodes]|uniref:uncharacterized protein n=1 Tax=Hypoxylon trugodes TaxID=326681 RepID=UPI00218D1582|nr:uncharacterized protein F4822DRAFT_9312 [Hypoxylon trugodes]KAI1393349.1 hypothetical protein F4822DRAFT_9312 [Hypoxylon trugodes]
MSSKHAWKVDLIPWDQKSAGQVNRLYEQRLACGWDAEEVPSFVESVKQGEKVFYWIVLADEVPERGAYLTQHIAKYSKEASPLTDTTDEVRFVPRVPSKKQFTPIGHIALAIHPSDEDVQLGLPRSGVAWVHQLYVSYVLQGGGFGAGAMGRAEQLAAMEPLNASIIALDTVAKEIHAQKEFLKLIYEGRGLPQPTKSNEEWYISLGYEIFARVKDGREYKYPGGTLPLEIIYLKKTIK